MESEHEKRRREFYEEMRLMERARYQDYRNLRVDFDEECRKLREDLKAFKESFQQ